MPLTIQTFKNEKIECILQRQSKRDNHYRAGWRPIGAQNYTFPTDTVFVSNGKYRLRSWTGINKANKEFHAFINNSKKVTFKINTPLINLKEIG